MITTRKIGKLTEISSDKYLHKPGSDMYVKKAILLPSETANDYEEVEELPKYTTEEYNKKVVELIRQEYTDTEEFAIQRKMINLLVNPSTISEDTTNDYVMEFNKYNSFVEDCKIKAISELSK